MATWGTSLYRHPHMAHLSIAGSKSEAAVGEKLHDESNHVAIWDHAQQLEVDCKKSYGVICSS